MVNALLQKLREIMDLALLDQREFVSRAELAKIFNVTELTIRRWQTKEGLPRHGKGKRPIYATAVVKEWLHNNRRAA